MTQQKDSYKLAVIEKTVALNMMRDRVRLEEELVMSFKSQIKQKELAIDV